MIFEAVCRECGETFNPNDEDDTIHAVRMNSDGEECGGQGDIVGTWGYNPQVDYFEKLKDAGVPVSKTSTGFKLG